MNIKKTVFTVIFFMLTTFVFSNNEKLQVYLRMDKQYFYSNEDIILEICVKNLSTKRNSFYIYDNLNEPADYTTFQPIVYDMNGIEAEIIVPYRLENKNLQNVIKGIYKRKVELGPEELLSHSVNLKDIYNLKENVKYRVKSFLFPDFNKRNVISSNNEVKFKILKERKETAVSGIISKFDRKQILRFISPAEVVLLHLDAEKTKNWERFKKYIYVEKFINSYSNYIRLYQLADNEEKISIEEDFYKFLTRERDDYILNFKIIKEEIENNNKISYVDVMVSRFGTNFIYRYMYRYTLEKYNGNWLISNLDASVLKGIRK